MKYIVISGIDGSGKTSVINSLIEVLEDKGERTYYVWMRYNHFLVKGMNALARIIGKSVKVNNELGSTWQHEYYKGQYFNKLYVYCSYIDNLISSYKVKKLSKLKYDYIICDRWINDIVIDLGSESRKMDFLDSKWYQRFQNILPLDTVQFLIEREKDAIMDCRVENRVDPNFPFRYELYKKLAIKDEVIIVNNSSSIDDSVDQIMKFI